MLLLEEFKDVCSLLRPYDTIAQKIIQQTCRVNSAVLDVTLTRLKSREHGVFRFRKRLRKNLTSISFSAVTVLTCQFFLMSLCFFRNLRGLDLSNGLFLRNEETKLMSRGLAFLPHLQNLGFHYNLFKCHRMQFIAKGLPFIPNLRFLDLSDNRIGDVGMKHIGKRFASICNLKYLYLRNSCTSDNGMKSLTKAVYLTPNLTYLDLGWNNIKARAIRHLAKTLAFLRNLSHIRLDWNNIPIKEMSTLAQALLSLPHVQFIDLRSNELGAEAREIFRTHSFTVLLD